MRMKLKGIAAAVALALGSASAFAAPIETGGLFFTARDVTNNTSFVVNLGVLSADFLATNDDYLLSGSGLSALTTWLSTADLTNTLYSVQGSLASPVGGLTTSNTIETEPLVDTRSGPISAGLSSLNTFIGVQNQNLGSSDGAQTNDGDFFQDFGNAAIGFQSEALLGSAVGFYQLVQGGRATMGSVNNVGGTWLLDFANGQASLSYSVSAVPLPAAFWLLGSGLLGMMGVSRRKSA